VVVGLLSPSLPRDHVRGHALRHDRCLHHLRRRLHLLHPAPPLQVRYHPYLLLPLGHGLHPDRHDCSHLEGVPNGFERSIIFSKSRIASRAGQTYSKDVVDPVLRSHEDVLVLDDCLF
jgi:hypothetical protein